MLKIKTLKPKKGETLFKYINRVADKYSYEYCCGDFGKYCYGGNLGLDDLSLDSCFLNSNFYIEICYSMGNEPTEYEIPQLTYKEFFNLYFEYVKEKAGLNEKEFEEFNFERWLKMIELFVKEKIKKKLKPEEEKFVYDNLERWYFLTKEITNEHEPFKWFYLAILRELLEKNMVVYLGTLFEVVDFWLREDEVIFEDFEHAMEKIIWNGKKWVLK